MILITSIDRLKVFTWISLQDELIPLLLYHHLVVKMFTVYQLFFMIPFVKAFHIEYLQLPKHH